MKKEITKLFSECNGRVNGYITLLSYRYMNLPIKAEPASLLPIKVYLGDSSANFEDAAYVTLDGDYKFVIYPKDQTYLASIQAGVTLQHPEFKQDLQRMEESEDEDDKVLILTMPEVDKDRYKELNDSVKALDSDCKSKLNLTFTYYAAQITLALIDADKKTQENTAKQLEDAKKSFEEMQKKLTDDKIKEIEEAHAAYMVKEQQKAESDKITEAEEGADTIFNMKMN